jgi:hypothetical protein
MDDETFHLLGNTDAIVIKYRINHRSFFDEYFLNVMIKLFTCIFIHFAAKFVLDRSSFLAALLTAVVATFLATLGGGLLSTVIATGWILLVIGIAIWALVAAIFFRARWIQGAIIGLVAWLLWFLVNLAINALFPGN